jgi:ABC-type transport system involved in multi-copper enzyme maturation permease subunit
MHGPRLSPLLFKEIREVLSGRALWTMLLFLCPLVGYSFFQATSLYGEASASARESPLLASGLSPLDGVLVPSFGALYLAITLLFPFVAIRTLGHEKETGALRLLVQLPYRAASLVAAKMAAIALAWLIAAIPLLSVLIIWAVLGGHLYAPETLNLLLGHLLYGLLVGSIALFAAAISESAATAAIIALAFTIGSWVLDFALAGQGGLLDWISRLSLTQTLRTFEQGLLSVSLLVGVVAGICGFAVLSAIWLHPGQPVRSKVIGSIICVAVAGAILVLATQIRTSIDVSEDRRNSFPAADQRVLAELHEPLIITVHLAPEDPRYVDLRRNVLSKLQRVMPNVTIRLATSGQTMVRSASDEAYGEIEYSYAGRSATTRSTSHREALPLLYGLAGKPIPTPIPGEDYPGFPLVRSGESILFWFLGALPALIVGAWFLSRRPPHIPRQLAQHGDQP